MKRAYQVIQRNDSRALGDFPLIGMFGSFEMGPLGGKNHLLAYTGVLVLVTEEG